jgi:hypothetical protein
VLGTVLVLVSVVVITTTRGTVVEEAIEEVG